MAELIITRGLPGSGKTTWALQQAHRTGAALVSRDDLRAMLHPGPWPHGDEAWEQTCTHAHLGVIENLLLAGRDVIAHDTNLRPDVVETLQNLADWCDAEFRVEDFTDVPLKVCLERDAAREHPVGEAVIRGMWRKYLAPEAEVQS